MKNNKKNKNNVNWIIKITLFALIMSFLFSTFSELVIPKINIVLCIILLFAIIFLGVIFDMIGLAITTCPIEPFHSMSSKKVKSAKMAINLIKSKEKVSSFCNDVIGDICGILSGTICVLISENISVILNKDIFIISLIVTSLSAAFTIGGKAVGKMPATKNSVWITDKVSKILSIFMKK